MTQPTFKGNLVHLSGDQLLTNEELGKSTISTKDHIEMHRGRAADSLAAFLTKHFLVVEGGVDGVRLKLRVTLMSPTVPKGVAHTPIIFQEIERCPSSVPPEDASTLSQTPESSVPSAGAP